MSSFFSFSTSESSSAAPSQIAMSTTHRAGPAASRRPLLLPDHLIPPLGATEITQKGRDPPSSTSYYYTDASSSNEDTGLSTHDPASATALEKSRRTMQRKSADPGDTSCSDAPPDHLEMRFNFLKRVPDERQLRYHIKFSGDQEVKKLRERERRMREQESVELSGLEIINFDGKFPANASDAETYENEFIEIKTSSLGGLGTFAAKNIEASQVILMEKPILRCDDTTLYTAYDALTAEQRKAFGRLHPNIKVKGEDKRYAIFRTNSFGTDGQAVVLLVASRFNHACRGRNNVAYHWDERVGAMVFHTYANKPIAKGTELTIRYTDSPLRLYKQWGFLCKCGACEPMSRVDREKLDHLLEVAEIDNFW